MPQANCTRVKIDLLGGFGLVGPGGETVEIAGRKTRGLLAILGLSPGLTQSRERLTGLLWSDRGEAQARSSLRQTLVTARRELQVCSLDLLAGQRDEIGLDPQRVSVDAVAFARLADEGRWQEAAALYAGPLLEGFSIRDEAFEEWLAAERRRLADLSIAVHEALVREAVPAARVAAARRLLALDPLRESAHRALMEALAAVGERDQALRQYEACREMLLNELSVGPEAATEVLCQQIREDRVPVAPVAPVPATPQASGAVAHTALAQAGVAHTAIAALPFANLSGDRDEDFFADGITEDLIGALAHFRHLTVVSHRTSQAYRTSNPIEVARELEVDFVLQGSVRRAGSRVRVSVQLIDAGTGAHVWADRLDRELDDILAVQDEIVSAVVGRLNFDLDALAGEQRLRDPARSGTAYTLFLKGRIAWREGREADALRLMEEAIGIDPDYPRALAYAGYFYIYGDFSMATDLSSAESHRLARERVERALARDRSDAFVLHRAAMVYALLGEAQLAMRYAEAAARLNPADLDALVVMGFCLAICGRPHDGLALIQRAVDTEPNSPPGYYSALADARYMAGDFEGCLAALDGILDPAYYVRLYRVPSLARLGRIEEARAIVAAAPEGFDSRRFAHTFVMMCEPAELSALWLEGFRLAGIEV